MLKIELIRNDLNRSQSQTRNKKNLKNKTKSTIVCHLHEPITLCNVYLSLIFTHPAN